ncbi:MAG: hypothetical protein H6524_02340 [Actinobacteria bacterium]|nr:hypothetical protein [Actinomycetota bacterium]
MSAPAQANPSTAQTGPRFIVTVVFAFLLTRVVAVIGAWIALAPTVPPSEMFRAVVTAWDGDWYQYIATVGYDSADDLTPGLRVVCDTPAAPDCHDGQPDRHSNLAFFTLFPLMIRALAAVGADPMVAAVGIAVIGSLVAAVLIAVIARDFAGPRFGVIAVVLWGCWPANIVLTSGRPESLFVALAAGTLLLALRHHFVWAAWLAAIAGLLRFQSIAIVVPLVLAAWVWGARTRNWRAPVVVTVIAPIGLVTSLAFIGQRMGRATGWFDIQREWKSTNDWGAAKLQYLADNLFGDTPTHQMAAWTIVAACLLFVAAVLIRIPWPLTVYAGILLAGVLVQAHFHQHSMRFLLVAFPLVFPIAWLLRRWPTWLVVVVLCATAVASATLQLWLWREGFSF